jgi:hypothetical protein
MVVQWKDGFDVLPFSMFWGYTSATFFSRTAYHMVDVSKSLRVGQGLGGEDVGHIVGRLDLSHSVQPVFYPRSVHHVCKDLLVCGLNEDE